jgi:hypothetical protein
MPQAEIAKWAHVVATKRFSRRRMPSWQAETDRLERDFLMRGITVVPRRSPTRGVSAGVISIPFTGRRLAGVRPQTSTWRAFEVRAAFAKFS